jgi:hypothetical protein
MTPPAEPRVGLNTRIDIATDERRRRLQRRTGLSAPRLIAEALRVFEARLEADSEVAAA